MGLFDFVKSAGEKLFGGDDDAPSGGQGGGGGAEATVDKGLIERRLAAALVAAIEKNGLEVEGLSVKVDDDVATVSGTVATQEVREKVVLVVGNTMGIAKVDDRMELAAPAATFYTVQGGDSLSKIAKEHYGDPSKYPAIFEANKPMLEHPDKIYPGQVLRIPSLDA